MYRINDRTVQEVLQTLDKGVVDASELARWTWSIEATAKSMSDDKTGNITFEYFSDEKPLNSLKDAKSRDNLLKSIQIHLPLIPGSVQGFFSVFKYDLKM